MNFLKIKRLLTVLSRGGGTQLFSRYGCAARISDVYGACELTFASEKGGL